MNIFFFLKCNFTNLVFNLKVVRFYSTIFYYLKIVYYLEVVRPDENI